ncbi:hypothetical protein GRI39_02000 [Altererythrobacter indicus]|uniref:Uncharacterized protein n=1 Tax=Altericroceibacterium indicum TaxID=374177 RepID=A0A845A636_9SPHN|nr:hypothetical protein [Altericroceibacterium indicum]MXP24819.1 hypothetical protein [Altericroceibacterium indicum]
MSKPRFGGLGGVMRGQVETPHASMKDMPEGKPETDPENPEDDDQPDDEEAGDGKKKDKPMSKDKEQQAAAPGAESQMNDGQQHGDSNAVAAAITGERQRIAAVFASDDVKGREMAAAELLANSDMSADAIVGMLPKLTPSASADEGSEMLQHMRENGQIDLGNEGGETQAEENHGWQKIHDEIRARRENGGF